jgi:hypothetical protein
MRRWYPRVGALLDFAKMVQHDHGYGVEAQLEAGEVASMPGQNSAATVYQNQRVESKSEDAAGNCGYLGFRVKPRISPTWLQPREQPMFDVLRHRLQRHESPRSPTWRCAPALVPMRSLSPRTATGSASGVVNPDRRSERVLANADRYRGNLRVAVVPGTSEMPHRLLN